MIYKNLCITLLALMYSFLALGDNYTNTNSSNNEYKYWYNADSTKIVFRYLCVNDSISQFQYNYKNNFVDCDAASNPGLKDYIREESYKKFTKYKRFIVNKELLKQEEYEVSGVYCFIVLLNHKQKVKDVQIITRHTSCDNMYNFDEWIKYVVKNTSGWQLKDNNKKWHIYFGTISFRVG